MEITQVEKDKLITLFVSYYGEQYKDYITKKINETVFVTVSSIKMKPVPKVAEETTEVKIEGSLSNQLSAVTDFFSAKPKPKPTVNDQYAEIREAVRKIKNQQVLEKSQVEDDNVVLFYNELAEKYPQVKNVELDFDLSYKIKKILKSCSSPEFYTKDVLELFSQLGIKFESIEELKQSEASKLIISHDPTKKFEEIDKKYLPKLAEADTLYQESVNKISSIPNMKKESLDVLVSDLQDFLLTDDSAQAYFTTYLTNDNQMHEMIVLPENFNDHQLAHELNHAIESHVLKITENGYTNISGFDKIKTSFNDTADYSELEKTHRKYEFLNEAINEYITLQLMAKAKELGITISADNKDQRSGYGLGVNLTKKFTSTFITELTECRLSNNPMQFAEIIGTENFEELASSISEIMSLDGIAIFDLHNRLEEKAGKSFEGIHGLMNNSSELLALDSLTPREREFVESLQRYSNISKSLIASKQEVKTG